MAQKTKQIIIIIVVIVVAFFCFKMFFADTQPVDTALVADQVNSATFVDGQVILNLLDKLNQVTIDESIFTNKVFVSLVNSEKLIEDQAAGRPNPFLPIGIDNSGSLFRQSTSSVRTR